MMNKDKKNALYILREYRHPPFPSFNELDKVENVRAIEITTTDKYTKHNLREMKLD